MALLAALAVFAPASVEAGEGYRLLKLDGWILKWGAAELGRDAHVTYAVADARITTPQARNCGTITPPEGALARSGIAPDVFDAELDEAFAVWARIAGLRFTRADSAGTADIVIGAQAHPRGFAFTNVDFRPGRDGVAKLTRSLICFNPERRWKIGFGGDTRVYDLRYMLIHEIGHAIGLDHAGPDGQIMGFRYGEDFRTPQAGDVSGAVALYGYSRWPVARANPVLQPVSPPLPAPDLGLGSPAD